MATPSRTVPLLAAAMLAVSLPMAAGGTYQSPAVAKLMSEARQALGGAESAAAIKTFRLKGRIKTGDPGESGAFEIVCALPDRFIQIEGRANLSPGQSVSEPSAGPSVEHRSTKLGFNGDALIFQPHVNRPSIRFNVLPPSQAQLQTAMKAARTGFTNLTLGLFAESFSGVPLQFSEATGPDQDTAVQVTGSDITGTLTFNRRTRLPERFGRMRYEDYRDVGGRKVAFRISDGRNEWIVEEFLVNVDVAAKVFTPTKR